MSAASSTSPFEPVANQEPALSEPERLANVFLAPSKTFADIRRNASWWVPFVISSIFAYALVFTVDKKVGFERVTENQIKLSPKAVERLDQLPPDQRARQMDISTKVTKIISYVIPVIVLIINLIIAGVLMATFNFGLGTEITYGQSLAVVMYAGLIGIVRAILAIATLLAGSNLDNFNFSNPVGTNPAYYMSIADTAPWLYRMAGWFDLLTIWLFVLLGIGYAVVGRKKSASGIAVMAGWFVVLVLVATGWAALTS